MTMRYQVTCLTPLLVGDGQKLAPIDYMIWKDQVNILDQRRIFRLLAKGPRLDSYLAQLKKAEKLDFASWGGFAQNFAGRRIPFEHATLTGYWEKAHAENLFIPTFASGPRGPFLPGTALKGALRTAMVFSRSSEGALRDVANRLEGDRPPRRPADSAEDRAIGNAGSSRTKPFSIGDSDPVTASVMKVYMLRVSTLQPRGTGFELGWKQSPRGTVDGRRPDDATPAFAEMAVPGTTFAGTWSEQAFFSEADVLKALNWRESFARERLFAAANEYSGAVLEQHRLYAEKVGLDRLKANIERLGAQLAQAKESGNSCVVPLGWGGGLLSKTAWPDTNSEAYRQVLRQVALYTRAIQTGLPFPKTRRIVFEGNQPSALPGWALLEVA